MGDTMLPKSTQRLRCTPRWARLGKLTPMIGSVSEDQGDTQQACDLHGRQRGTAFEDLLGIAICDLLDLKQPGCLRERFQSFLGQAVLQILIFKPFF